MGIGIDPESETVVLFRIVLPAKLIFQTDQWHEPYAAFWLDGMLRRRSAPLRMAAFQRKPELLQPVWKHRH
jgi:hypothetical protein